MWCERCMNVSVRRAILVLLISAPLGARASAPNDKPDIKTLGPWQAFALGSCRQYSMLRQSHGALRPVNKACTPGNRRTIFHIIPRHVPGSPTQHPIDEFKIHGPHELALCFMVAPLSHGDAKLAGKHKATRTLHQLLGPRFLGHITQEYRDTFTDASGRRQTTSPLQSNKSGALLHPESGEPWPPEDQTAIRATRCESIHCTFRFRIPVDGPRTVATHGADLTFKRSAEQTAWSAEGVLYHCGRPRRRRARVQPAVDQWTEDVLFRLAIGEDGTAVGHAWAAGEQEDSSSFEWPLGATAREALERAPDGIAIMRELERLLPGKTPLAQFAPSALEFVGTSVPFPQTPK